MPDGLLYTINDPSELRTMSASLLVELAHDLRRFIIDIVATKEGHLGSSLGVVELTIALHYVFNTPNDKLIWDVGHQAYGHKILTGRRDNFDTNRQYKGLSGFPKISESIYDSFGTGHSSTSISAALGMAMAARLSGDLDRQHIAIIGDASIASGMAFEGLNHAGETSANLLVILNDNAIGIDPSVGALKRYLGNLKTQVRTRETFFEALGFAYTGPIDGHDLDSLVATLKKLKEVDGPRLLHIVTTKGKGLKTAETDQVKYHAPGRFNASTGELDTQIVKDQAPKFQDVFGHTLVELARENKKIIGITPAMPTGSSLKYMMVEFPHRAFDVGIAEQHAVTLAAGMATQGFVVFCTIYSTFLQRAYDQIVHDVALQNLPVIFCVDRAGLVGEDGATHHGAFDIAYLNAVPNLLIYAPKDAIDLRNMLYTASLGLDHPIAIRYPRGRGSILKWQLPFQKITIGKASCLVQGTQLAILATGTMTQTALKASKGFENRVGVYYFGFIKPLDLEMLDEILARHSSLITLEDGTRLGGFGSAVSAYASEKKYQGRIEILGIPDEFVEQGPVEILHKEINLDVPSITSKIRELLNL